MLFIWKYLRCYPLLLMATLLGTLGFVAVTLGLPTLLAQMINRALLPNNADLLWRYALGMLLLSLAGIIGRLITSYSSSRIVTSMTMTIRNDVYEKMQNLSHHEFQELGVPSLTNRITTDPFIILQFVEMIIRQGITAPIMIIVSIYMVWQTSADLGSRILPLAPIILLLIILIVRITLPISEKQQLQLDKINRILRESLTGLRVIRAFNREAFQQQRFENTNTIYRGLSTQLFKWMAVTPAAFSLMINLAIIALMWYGADFINRGELLVGDLVALIEYVFHALYSLTLFANIFMLFPRAAVSAKRLQEVMATPITIQEIDDPVIATSQAGCLEFRQVDFAYPDAAAPVLRNISFKSDPGETIAFIGSTGSGKSTIVKLIPRFYDVTKGAILVDGVDVRDFALQTLRGKIGFTPQKALLFSGDISANLRYGKADATATEIEQAAAVAQAREFIDRLETKYQTQLAEGGSNFSGGQKQRLSIARSVIAGREIYIFDDSFSALDYKTDAAVRQALKEITKDATTIIVAQRVGTIMHADQIIVLEEGEIVAQGTHQELLRSSALYLEIAKSQLSEEELAHE